MKVLIVHPGKQHSYRTAEALYKEGVLEAFVTACYYRPFTLTSVLYRFSGDNQKKKIRSHRSDLIPNNQVRVICEFMGIVALALKHFPRLAKLYTKWNNTLNKQFAQIAAQIAINKKVDAVISYDSNSVEFFEILKDKNPNIIRILDVSISARPFMRKNFEADIERNRDSAIIKEEIAVFDETVLDRTYREVELADYFLVPSKIVETSLIFCGAKKEKIYRVPYGVDCNKFPYRQKTKSDKLKIIYVGQINHRKGIHHLLHVVSQFPEDKIEVSLAGIYDKCGNIYLNNKDKGNVHFVGFLTHDKLVELYSESDVFVFPTIGEGFGMVVLEAMSCGVPVVSSDLAGGHDIIENGINGFVYEAGNLEQLKQRISWLIDNMESIPILSENARKTAEIYNWDRYYHGIANAIRDIQDREGII